jgi:hypothetical protein
MAWDFMIVAVYSLFMAAIVTAMLTAVLLIG